MLVKDAMDTHAYMRADKCTDELPLWLCTDFFFECNDIRYEAPYRPWLPLDGLYSYGLYSYGFHWMAQARLAEFPLDMHLPSELYRPQLYGT